MHPIYQMQQDFATKSMQIDLNRPQATDKSATLMPSADEPFAPGFTVWRYLLIQFIAERRYKSPPPVFTLL